jgi:hypothetical protein
MSAVILRCDNCGTTHSVRGPCETCHEGTVRYFCKNHEPGRWLETPRCPDCGAEYGVTVAAPARPRLEEGRNRAGKVVAPTERPAPRASRPPKRFRGPWGPRPPRSPDEIPVSDEMLARARALDRLRRLLEAGSYSRRTVDPTEFTYGTPAPMIAGGCLRIILLMMLFFLLFAFLGLANFGNFFIGY